MIVRAQDNANGRDNSFSLGIQCKRAIRRSAMLISRSDATCPWRKIGGDDITSLQQERGVWLQSSQLIASS